MRTHTQFTCWEPLSDLASNWLQWIVILLLTTISLCLTFALSDESCPPGYLGPGGISDWGNYENCTGGAAGIIDRWFFGENHLYQHPTAKVHTHTHQHCLSTPYSQGTATHTQVKELIHSNTSCPDAVKIRARL